MQGVCQPMQMFIKRRGVPILFVTKGDQLQYIIYNIILWERYQ